MGKHLLVKLGTIAATLSLLSGATYAYFNSNSVSITGVTLGAATPTLQVETAPGTWGSTAVGFTDANLYPGKVASEHAFWLQNISGGSVPFARIIPTISDGIYTDSTWAQWKNSVQLRFREDGTTLGSEDGWLSLESWVANTTTNLVSTDLSDGTWRKFYYQVRMAPEADQSLAGNKQMGFVINFVGQTP